MLEVQAKDAISILLFLILHSKEFLFCFYFSDPTPATDSSWLRWRSSWSLYHFGGASPLSNKSSLSRQLFTLNEIVLVFLLLFEYLEFVEGDGNMLYVHLLIYQPNIRLL